MLLAVDAGNTNVEFALFEHNHLICQWRASSSVKRTSDEWASWLIGLMRIAEIDATKISSTIISCVVPNMLNDLKDLSMFHLGHHPLVIGEDSLDFGFDVEVGNPAEVGADLLVGAAAVKHYYGAPALILDMGTATTLSLLNHRGNFAGVAIAPGLEHSAKVLSDAAAKLPQVNWAKPEKVIGTNTITAIQGGIFWGYLGLIENLIKNAKKQYLEEHPEAEIKVIASGGLARHIIDHTKLIDTYDPDLNLKGLQYVFERNQTSTSKKLARAL